MDGLGCVFVEGFYNTAVCLLDTTMSLTGDSTHGRALSTDCFCFGEIAPHGHVPIRHGRVMAKGVYDMVMPYGDFLIMLVIFLAF